MKRKIKIGDKVKLLNDVIQDTVNGDEKYLRGTIGMVCDDENPNCPIVELKDSAGVDRCNSFSINDLEIIK